MPELEISGFRLLLRNEKTNVHFHAELMAES